MSDVGIWGAYMAIPVVLGFFIFKRRTPLPLVTWLFVAFIACCGIGHLLEAAIFWYPMYRLAGVWKSVTAAVSWATVAAMVPVVPKVLRWPTLAEVNSSLEREIARRQRSEEDLRAANEEMGRMNAELELRDAALNQHSIVAVTDADGTIKYVNDRFCAISGYSARELIGRNHSLINSGFHGQDFFADMYATIHAGRVWRGEIRNRAKDGSFYWVDTTIVPIRGADGKTQKFVSIRTDITERKHAEQSLRESEERCMLAIRGSQDGVWDWDLSSDRVYYAPRWKELLGVSDVELSPTPEEWYARIANGDVARFRESVDRLRMGEAELLDIELEMTHSDGSPRWVLCRGAASRDASGRAVRASGSIADITELRRAQDELSRMARHDSLTGLFNREVLTERLAQSIARAQRDGRGFALLFFDFDRFKVINDSLGHNAGDGLLVSIGERLRAQTRACDTAARFGGDEFVVLLDRVNSDAEVEQTCDRLLEVLAEPHSIDGHEVVSTASIGVVCWNPRYTSPEEMIRDADAAMYAAKMNGKAQFRVFDQRLHADAVERMRLEQDMRRASPEGEFRLLYQPIVSLESGKVAGFEALLRWEHPSLGTIDPEKFISIAEETGHIVPIGRWVMRTACAQLRAWTDLLEGDGVGPSEGGGGRGPGGPTLRMNVNLSRRQLLEPNLIDDIRRVLEDTGVRPDALRLEITESAVMNDMSSVIEVMNRIRRLGVSLAIDDFGTGYSSLSCLHQFPIDVLKIDRSFVRHLEERWAYTAVLHSIVTLAHHLRMEVVAEGIETRGQVAQLQGMECRLGQGYLFSRPVAPEKAWGLLSALGAHRAAA